MSSKAFSLIVATFGRLQEVDKFLQSIVNQEYDLSKVEVWIVDQNSANGIELAPIISKYQDSFEILHIKSDQRGLSLNRNIALRSATGKFVAFPDDDCLYYSNTLSQVEKAFNTFSAADIILGRILDRSTNKNIIRDWKNYSFPITKKNFFLNYSSITMFSRKTNILFDETLGLGTYYGSCEDTDFIVQALQRGEKIQYTPDIEVWHPDSPPIIDFQKVYSYGLGFGALCRKYTEPFAISLFFQSIGYHFVTMMLSIIVLNLKQAKRRYLSIKSRVHGFISYRK